MSEYGYITHSELMHHGIKGQKWGIRRYQNADGSYKAGSEGRYYHPIRGLVRKIHSLPRNITDFKRPSEKKKREEERRQTVSGKIAFGAKTAANYGKEKVKDTVKEKLSSGKEKKIVDKNSYAYKKAKYDRAAAIATSAITAASIAGMGALMGSKALKNKKAAHNAMLKLVDNKIGGTSIKGSSVAKAALTGAKLSSKGKDNARAILKSAIPTSKGGFKTANARAFLKDTAASTRNSRKSIDEAAYNLFEKNYRYSIGRNGKVSDHARSYLINNGVKGTINRNAQLLKKKKR